MSRRLTDADALAAHVKEQYGQVDVLFINAIPAKAYRCNVQAIPVRWPTW
ncbi:hypothetical protein [Chitinophaga japonensis]|nr:hypothetical protein [Chitinophaga japonensis]